VQANPTIRWDLNKKIQELQRNQQFQDATGYMVWLHTLRAATTPEVKLKGRKMWGQLRRGLPYVAAQAEQFAIATGRRLKIDDFDAIPIDLDPDFR